MVLYCLLQMAIVYPCSCPVSLLMIVEHKRNQSQTCSSTIHFNFYDISIGFRQIESSRIFTIKLNNSLPNNYFNNGCVHVDCV